MSLIMYLSIIFSGDYVLYWSFDTLENLTLMRLNNASDFDSLIPGQVRYIW